LQGGMFFMENIFKKNSVHFCPHNILHYGHAVFIVKTKKLNKIIPDFSEEEY